LWVWTCAVIFGLHAALAQSEQPPAPPKSADPCGIKVVQPACSYTGLNGSCTVTINRLTPVTPPPIYAKTKAVITVKVVNPSPLEDLTLDWSSTAVVVPPDTLASLLSSSVTGVIGKFAVIHTGPGAPIIADPAPAIAKEQEALLEEITSGDPQVLARAALTEIHRALQPPPGDICWIHLPTSDPWLQTPSWKTAVVTVLTRTKSEAETSTTDVLRAKIASIDQEIVAANTAPAEELHTLQANQKVLTDTLDARIASSKTLDLARFQALIDAINAIPDHGDGLQLGRDTIRDAQPNDKNDQNQVWILNYVNKLGPVAKRVSAPGALQPDPGPLGSLADSSKQQLVKLTVQFQRSSPLEVTTGLLVPVSPYHSYVKAAVANNGTVTNNVVQQNLTYTVVPAVFVHFLAHEVTGKQRLALFFTVAPGYNPASSSVEFGVGPSLGWHSIVFSGLADIGRDTDLQGGFKVGQSLGLTNAANPLTGTVWRVKPALAISVRIPLGSSGK
jgi:hypothetical protein